MQTKSLNYTEQDNLSYKVISRAFDITVSVVVLSFFIFIFGYFFLRKLFTKQKIFQKEKFFLNSKEVITISLFNTKNIVIRSNPSFYYVLTNKISIVGVYLLKYRKNIDYKVEQKAGLFSLWFIRKYSKMPDYTISSSNKEYLQNRSFLNDMKIFCKALISLLYVNLDNKYFKKVKIFDISFDNLKMSEIITSIKQSIDTNSKKVIYFINADCLNKTFSDEKYKQILKNASCVLPDGSGINIACNILQKPLLQNLNGTDMLPYICELSSENSYKIFLLGAKDGVALKMKKQLEDKYPNIQIVGAHHGFFKNEDEKKEAINYVNSTNADILFVAMGAPIQEMFIDENKDNLNAKVILAVGGLFDFYSCNIKRAPVYIREIGFEWIYRMIQEPKRMWKRYILGNPLFLFRVYKYKKEEKKLLNSYLDNYTKPRIFGLKKYLWSMVLFSSAFFKRALDIVGSFILLILFIPLFIVIAFVIKATSKGDIFFAQNRVGLHGKLFKMYKFRSMVMDAEELKAKLINQNQSKDGVIFKMQDDPRITKIGKFIRKTSIDELPQLLNVLKGEMSLVGPRPPVIDEVKQYNVDDKKRLDVKPGITCIWQVSGRSSIPFKEQVKMDKLYIKDKSFCKDIVLLFKTIPAVLFQKGSY